MLSLVQSVAFIFRNCRKKCFYNAKWKLSKYRHGPSAAQFIGVLIVLMIIFLNIEYIVEVFKDFIYGEQNNNIKIDWHDWRLVDEEELRTGIGEHGEGAFLLSYPSYTKQINDTHGYNGYLSDKIALNRSLKDLRPKEYVFFSNVENVLNKKNNCKTSISVVYMKSIQPICPASV